jgi:DNA-binding NarL/FixJ family response regulator
MRKITVLIVDDHPLIRKAWGFTINQDSRFKVVGEIESGEAAVEVVKQLCPDIVIMDICLTGISGIEATQLIRMNCPNSKIIGLSFHINLDFVHEMMQRGAMGYLTKNASIDEIFKAILEVSSGRTYICQEVENAFKGELRVQENQKRNSL